MLVRAQETDSVKNHNFKHSIGLHAGLLTAYGLSYKYDFNKWAIQTVFSPRHTQNNDLFSFGLNLYRIINTGQNTSLFLYYGNHLFYNKNYYNKTTNEFSEFIQYHSGLGYGIRINFSKRVYFNIMGGLGVIIQKGESNIMQSIENIENQLIVPSGEVSLFYSF